MKRFLFLLLALSALLFGKVDINTANAQQLSELKGIGPTKAEAIVEWRKQHGKFKNIDELTQVKGIGPKTVEKLKDELTVSK